MNSYQFQNIIIQKNYFTFQQLKASFDLKLDGFYLP